MKNIIHPVSLVSLVFAALLVGCGGGSTPLKEVRGVVIDGYIKEANVCIDTNSNDKCDETEIITTTDANGSFTLHISDGSKNHTILATGGVDTATNSAFNGTLKNILQTGGLESVLLTPLSTLATNIYLQNVKNDTSYTLFEAKEKLANTLGLGVELIDTNPLDNKDVFSKTQQLVQTIAILKDFIQKSDDNTTTDTQAHDYTMNQIAKSVNGAQTNNLDIEGIIMLMEAGADIVIPDEISAIIDGNNAIIETITMGVNTEELILLQGVLENRTKSVLTNANLGNFIIPNIPDDYSDTIIGAKVINLNMPIEGDLKTSNDIDYFKFILDETTTIELEKEASYGTAGNKYHMHFELFQGDHAQQQILHEIIDKDESFKHLLTLEAGTYYIKISPLLENYEMTSSTTGYLFALNVVSGVAIADDYPNTPEDAQVIELDTYMLGNLETTYDMDIFTFTLEEATTIEFAINTINDAFGSMDSINHDRYVYFYLFQQRIETERPFSTLFYSDENLNNRLTLKAGTYYIMLRGNSRDTAKYGFILNSTSANISNDDYPDTINQAHKIELGEHITGDFETSSDSDFFTFTLDKTTIIEFEKRVVNRPSEGLLIGEEVENYAFFDIFKMDDNATQILSSLTLNNRTTTKQALTLEAGTYHIGISMVINHFAPIENLAGYWFTLHDSSEILANDDYPNTMAEAHEIALNKRIEGLLETLNDSDYFTFTLDKTTTVELTSEGADRTQRENYFIGSGIYIEISQDDNGTVQLFETILDRYKASKYALTLEAGTYYIKISRINSMAFEMESTMEYDIGFHGKSGVVYADDYPNSTDEAHNINLNTRLNGKLETSDDIDYFVFTLNKTTTIEFEKQTVHIGDNSYNRAYFNLFEAWGETGQLLSESFSSSWASTHILTLEAGTYYIGISSDMGNTMEYWLNIRTYTGWLPRSL